MVSTDSQVPAGDVRAPAGQRGLGRPAVVEALGAAGQRLTGPRRAVAELVAVRDGHFTAADLLEEARARGLPLGRATVFRALDLFDTLGILERIELPGGDRAYVACRPRHHHHIVCEACGRVDEVDDRGLTTAVDDVQHRTGWQVASHRLELYGRCPRCRARRPARPRGA